MKTTIMTLVLGIFFLCFVAMTLTGCAGIDRADYGSDSEYYYALQRQQAQQARGAAIVNAIQQGQQSAPKTCYTSYGYKSATTNCY